MNIHRTPVVLMAEDDLEDRLLLKEALDECEFNQDLRFVGDGEELLDYLRRQGKYRSPHSSPQPSLILLDLKMPKKDGLEALKDIKEDLHLKCIPIVILTTSSSEDDVYSSYALGASSYLVKPGQFRLWIKLVKVVGTYWFEHATLPLDASGFTTQEVKATTPRIPDLEVTIPAGTRIIGPDGNPVSQLVITPVPVDRSPMPFPPGVTFPYLFAINPGGAVPSNPLPISFPNVEQAPPGSQADLYYFDLAIGTWNVWGTGTVSADGRQIVSDPGFGLPRLAWHSTKLRVPTPEVLRERHAKCCEPIDLVTGRFVVSKTDLVLPARLPIAIQRHYGSSTAVIGLFGRGWNLETYDTRI
ncbi:MAG: response regulator, partial [Armatimonadetes bacterium]|nr:response regulator [Armatimonadota bacterium]